jgi:acyl-CoA thioesterase-1
MHRRTIPWLFVLLLAGLAPPAAAADRPAVGLVPKATKPIVLDGKLDEWDGAFATPVHVGHPDFADRGAQFLFLWDDDALYVGLRALDRKPAHVRPDATLWDGDAVEFYLDTRRGADLGAKEFGPGTLHMFWTPLTGTEVKPRWRVRDLPAFKDLTLKGVELAGATTKWGYTAEFKLPWTNFPKFTPKAGEMLGIDCELCSSDGGPRVDRTFVYSSPASVSSPAAFGPVRLVNKAEPADLKACARALLPVSVTKSANYDWLYATACVSPTIDKMTAKIEGKVLDTDGKVRKTTPGSRTTLDGSGFVLWRGSWELFDLPAGTYTVEVSALDRDGKPVVTRTITVAHGTAPVTRAAAGGEAIRIVALGDSITRGVRAGVKDDETFAALLQTAVRKEHGRAEVANAGVGGERTDGALKRLDRDVLSANPRLVLVMYGTNDSYVDRGQKEPRLSVEQYRANLTELVARLRKGGAEPVLMTPPRWGEKATNGLGENPNLRLEEYVRACREVAKETKAPLVDHYAHWSKAASDGTDVGGWTTDQCHPNPRGHREIAEQLLPVVRDLLGKARKAD